MVQFKHGNYMTGSPNNSLFHNNIMEFSPKCSDQQCLGCDMDLKSYYDRSSGSTCPCTDINRAYNDWYLNRHVYYGI